MGEAQHQLCFGDVPLVSTDPSDLAYEVNTLAELDFGNPEPVVAPIQSLLLDGSLAEVLSYDNRNIVLRVTVSGPTLDDVAQGSADLMAEVRKGRNVLKWTPPDEFAAPTVFDVIWSRLDKQFDDMGELRRERTFVISLNCAPFGRDEEETVVQAVGSGAAPPTPVTATIDSASALTGWSLFLPGPDNTGLTSHALTVTDGGVRGGLGGPARPNAKVGVTVGRTGLAASMATTPYLIVTARFFYAHFAFQSLRFQINSLVVEPLARSGNDFYFDASGFSTINSVAVTASHLSNGSNKVGYLDVSVDDISRTNVAPFVGSGRQQFRSLTVGGSARTEASLAIEHTTSALGEVLVYTAPANATGYQPPLRQYRNISFGATPTPDSAMASGARSLINAGTPETYDVPATALIRGTHLLMALVKGSTSGFKTINVTVSTLVGTTKLGAVANAVVVNLPTTGWTIVSLGRMALPPVALPAGSTSKVRIELSCTDAVEVDEALIFNTDVGRVSWVNCGTASPSAGGSSSRLWIDTANLDWPRPAIWLGTLADRTDARHAIGATEVRSMGTHMFEPGDVNLYTLTSNATNVAASARFYVRHQHDAVAG